MISIFVSVYEPNVVVHASTATTPTVLPATLAPKSTSTDAAASGVPALVIWACVAAAEISISTSIWPVAPRLAWLISMSTMSAKFWVAVVMKSKLPSSSFRPWKVVVWAIRLMASKEESICNWLAAICSVLRAPSLAASVTRPRMSFNRAETWPRALSAVAITWLARSLLLIAMFTLLMSARSTSLAIKPAGSSLPVLMRKPVLRRVNALCNAFCDLIRDFCALSALTFVLIRVMPDTLSY